jgi:hypothetical protein
MADTAGIATDKEAIMNQSTLCSFAAAAVLACGAILPAGAQNQVGNVEPQSANGVPYVTGGIGMEERQAMQELSPQYNVKLTFADKGTGDYRSGVAVEVRDMHGNVRLQTNEAGPLLYARLPPGRYRVTANADGQQQERTISVGSHGGKAAAFYWDAEPPMSMGR